MRGDSFEYTDADPHVVRQSATDTDGEFVRFESTLYPREQAMAAGDLPHEPWSLDYRIEHVHPDQEERWKVLDGTLAITVDGERRTLSEGEETTLPEGVPHEHWNPADEPARVVWERRPGFEDDAWAESLFTLAQRGAVDENGVPPFLHLSVINDEYSTECVYLPRVPIVLQRVGFSTLGAIGRLAGYEAEHARQSSDGVPS